MRAGLSSRRPASRPAPDGPRPGRPPRPGALPPRPRRSRGRRRTESAPPPPPRWSPGSAAAVAAEFIVGLGRAPSLTRRHCRPPPRRPGASSTHAGGTPRRGRGRRHGPGAGSAADCNGKSRLGPRRRRRLRALGGVRAPRRGGKAGGRAPGRREPSASGGPTGTTASKDTDSAPAAPAPRPRAGPYARPGWEHTRRRPWPGRFVGLRREADPPPPGRPGDCNGSRRRGRTGLRPERPQAWRAPRSDVSAGDSTAGVRRAAVLRVSVESPATVSVCKRATEVSSRAPGT